MSKEIIKEIDGVVVQVTEREVRAKAGVPLPDYIPATMLANLGYIRPATGPQPEIEPHQIAKRDGFEKNESGVWQTAWKVEQVDRDDMLVTQLDKLEAIRKVKETGGLIYNGLAIKTDEKTWSRLIATEKAMAARYISKVSWKMSDGRFHEVNKSTVGLFIKLVSVHIAACFDAEAKVTAELEAIDECEPMAAYDVAAKFAEEYAAVNERLLGDNG